MESYAKHERICAYAHVCVWYECVCVYEYVFVCIYIMCMRVRVCKSHMLFIACMITGKHTLTLANTHSSGTHTNKHK